MHGAPCIFSTMGISAALSAALHQSPSPTPTMTVPESPAAALPDDLPESTEPPAAAERHVRAAGGELVKQEGRVFVRFQGEVQADLLRVPYRLVPEQGVLARPAKWRKMDADAQLALVQERVTAAAMERLQSQVAAFVREIEEDAEDAGLDAMVFLQALADRDSADPAGFVFDSIRQRLQHAIERDQEERHAALTRESINLAEYPDSFEMARRLPRRFIALLGPTNSGKTHQAMETLIQCEKRRLSGAAAPAGAGKLRAAGGRPSAWRGAEGQPGHRRGTPPRGGRDPCRQHRGNAGHAHPGRCRRDRRDPDAGRPRPRRRLDRRRLRRAGNHRLPGRRAGSAPGDRGAGRAAGVPAGSACAQAQGAAVDGSAGRAESAQPAPRRRGDRVFAARRADVARHDHRDRPVGGDRVRQPVARSAAGAGRSVSARARPTSWWRPMRWRWG